jgi:hypothetical protein
MYLQRRNGRYWFRKATPLDLVEVLGQAEVRCSLRTNRRDVAKRRAGALLVALENVYAVLRSEEPLEPAQALLSRFLQDVSENASGTPESTSMTAMRLQEAASSLGLPAPPLSNGDSETWVSVDDVVPLLATEQPRAEANVAATELLKLAIRMRREKGWSRAQRAKALVALCQKVTLANQNAALDTPHGLQALRAIIREEVSRAGLGTTINQTPQFDAAALREIVAGEVRAGVTAAGRDRWSTERLSTLIEKFLEARYPVDDGKSKVGSKHRGDVESRLAAFLLFTGDKAIRDVTRLCILRPVGMRGPPADARQTGVQSPGACSASMKSKRPPDFWFDGLPDASRFPPRIKSGEGLRF